MADKLRRIRRLAGCVLVLFASACGDASTPGLYPVEGEVFVKAQPAAGARVVLHPAPGSAAGEWAHGYPRAIVGDDGKFKVTTATAEDGAPPGPYVVLVEWPAVTDKEAVYADEHPPKDRLGGRYNNPASSKLQVTVPNQPLVIPRFDLK